VRPIATLVEAIRELEVTGRLSDDTRSKLIDLEAAERFRHPSADLEVKDGPDPE